MSFTQGMSPNLRLYLTFSLVSSTGWNRLKIPTIEEFLAEPQPPVLWSCRELLPAGGITLLHGKTSVGKSPFTWEIARAISTGQDAFGLFNTTKSRVLYVEGDTPKVQMYPRLKLLPKPVGDWYLACVQGMGLDIALPSAKGTELLKYFKGELDPEVIVWNTLRALTVADLSKGETVSRTYYNIRAFFPSASHLVVHHDRKESTSKDSQEIPDESFSGSAGWRDTAQVALNIWKGGVKEQKITYVRRTKSQVGPEMEKPIKLILEKDGTNWTLTENPKLTQIRTILAEPIPVGYSNYATYIQEALKLNKTQAYDLIKEASVIPDSGLPVV